MNVVRVWTVEKDQKGVSPKFFYFFFPQLRLIFFFIFYFSFVNSNNTKNKEMGNASGEGMYKK